MNNTSKYIGIVLLCLASFACDESSNVQVERTADDGAAQTQPAPVTADDVKQQLGEAARVTGEYISGKSAQWSADAQAKLAEMQSSVNEWRENNAGPKFDAWREEMARLTDVANEKLAGLKDASAETWDDLKAAADEAAAKARAHWEEGKKQFSDSDADTQPEAEE